MDGFPLQKAKLFVRDFVVFGALRLSEWRRIGVAGRSVANAIPFPLVQAVQITVLRPERVG